MMKTNTRSIKPKTRSILEEINALSPKRDKKQIIASNGEQIIVSAINLIKMIDEGYDIETAEDLKKRLISSIRNKNPRKFHKGISNISKVNEHGKI